MNQSLIDPSTATELHERTLATTEPDPGPDASLAYRLSPQVQRAMVVVAFAAFAIDPDYLIRMADSSTRVASGQRPRMPSQLKRPGGDWGIFLGSVDTHDEPRADLDLSPCQELDSRSVQRIAHGAPAEPQRSDMTTRPAGGLGGHSRDPLEDQVPARDWSG